MFRDRKHVPQRGENAGHTKPIVQQILHTNAITWQYIIQCHGFRLSNLHAIFYVIMELAIDILSLRRLMF